MDYGGFLYLINASIVPYDNTSGIQVVIEHYQSGLAGTFIQNVTDWHQLYNVESAPFIFMSIFPMFLVGLAIAKSDWLTSITNYQGTINKLWIAAGAVGLTLKLLPLLRPSYLLYSHVSEAFGGPLLGLFYALSVIMFVPKMHGIQAGLSALGRMSMTNYLFQSGIGFLIFKFFGLYGETSPTANFFISILIVMLQTILSRHWLRSNQYGPVENIWRKFTYGQICGKKMIYVNHNERGIK